MMAKIADAIKKRAGYEDLVFTYMESYDDAITEALVNVASDHLSMERNELLEAFGAYWVLETAQKSYGHFFKMGGNSVREFVANLDQIHSRFSVSFSDIKPPEFKVIEDHKDKMIITYESERDNYLSLTIGLLKGLYTHFNEKGGVKVVNENTEGSLTIHTIELSFV